MFWLAIYRVNMNYIDMQKALNTQIMDFRKEVLNSCILDVTLEYQKLYIDIFDLKLR